MLVRYSQSPCRHPSDDVADAARTVEASVHELQLRRTRLEGEEAEGGAESLLAVTAHRHGRTGPYLLVDYVKVAPKAGDGRSIH
jgi:hypothetical protein